MREINPMLNNPERRLRSEKMGTANYVQHLRYLQVVRRVQHSEYAGPLSIGTIKRANDFHRLCRAEISILAPSSPWRILCCRQLKSWRRGNRWLLRWLRIPCPPQKVVPPSQQICADGKNYYTEESNTYCVQFVVHFKQPDAPGQRGQ